MLLLLIAMVHAEHKTEHKTSGTMRDTMSGADKTCLSVVECPTGGFFTGQRQPDVNDATRCSGDVWGTLSEPPREGRGLVDYSLTHPNPHFKGDKAKLELQVELYARYRKTLHLTTGLDDRERHLLPGHGYRFPVHE